MSPAAAGYGVDMQADCRVKARGAAAVVGCAVMAAVLSACGGFTSMSQAPPSPPVEAATPSRVVDLSSIPQIPFSVVATYPHDANAWTQGLAYAAPDRLYEGTGDYENSGLREVVLSTGVVARSTALPSPQMYGEGITVLGEEILQLTWRDGIGLVYRPGDFTLQREFRYPAAGTDAPREGWGITTDGVKFFVSDGSANVYVADAQRTLDSRELAVTGVVPVHWQGQPVDRLNELEYVDGAIFANVWQTGRIVRFDAASGAVDGQLDVSGLLADGDRQRAETSNGIAHDPVTGELLVTGKKWPQLFALRLG